MYQAQAHRASAKLGPSAFRILSRPLQEFLEFRRLITPQVIQIVFWFGVAYSVIAGLTVTVMGLVGNGVLLMLGGLLVLALGPILVRIACELVLVIFSINDTLTLARKNSLNESTPPA
jgi:hypothetical protein